MTTQNPETDARILNPYDALIHKMGILKIPATPRVFVISPVVNGKEANMNSMVQSLTSHKG